MKHIWIILVLILLKFSAIQHSSLFLPISNTVFSATMKLSPDFSLT